MVTKNRIIFFILKIIALLFGVFLVIYGGFDDSPGTQSLGLMIIFIITILVVRKKIKKNHS